MSNEKLKKMYHDQCVRALAQELKADNWQVKANAEGYEKPSNQGNFVPDIEAKKGCLRRICEVTDEKDFVINKTLYKEIKNYCDEYDFHLYVIDKEGKRIEIDPQTFGKKQLNTKL